MNKIDQTHPEFSPLDEEELVAYLDGELDDEACQRVEQRLADDPAYRQELQRLQRAWDCLDRLPETAVDETFIRDTVEMVTLAASQEVEEAKRVFPVRQRAHAVLTAGALLLSLLAGFALVAVAWPDPNDELVRNLPVLEHLEPYRNIDNVEFLRSLAATGLFQRDEFHRDPAAPARSDESWEGRYTWIAQLPAERKTVLLNSQKRFSNLSHDEQARLHQLHDQIARDAQADDLRETMAEYYDWLSELSPGRRADLLAMPSTERLEAIRKMRGEYLAQRNRRLSPADSQVVLAWLGEQVLAHREKILEGIPNSRREHFDRMTREQQQGLLLTIAFRRSRFNSNALIEALQPEDLAALQKKVSSEAQARLAQAESLEQQKRLITAWSYATLSQRRLMSRTFRQSSQSLSQEELETFFEQGLTTDQRVELLSLPADEMQRELRRLYFQGGPAARPMGPPPRGHNENAFPSRRLFREGGRENSSNRRRDGREERRGDSSERRSHEMSLEAQ